MKNVFIVNKASRTGKAKELWNKVGEQILLFGRYHCKAIKPECNNCLFKNKCKNRLK